ncbi:hypothetical protein BSKO_11769 [Bryopsis sp. KO-2023]|nr:hypothetical protein BSKO_11769 [Bryopsis sp. KO-2023]
MARPRWGDEEDDEDALPPRQESGLDENGVKTITEYYRDQKGRAMKRTTKVKVAAIKQKVYKVSEQRRNWPKFGASTTSGNEGVTGRSPEEIPFENTRAAGKSHQEKKVEDLQAALMGGDNQKIVGSLKDLLYQKKKERELKRARGELAEAEKPPDEDAPAAPRPGAYVPPSMRNRPPGSAAPEPVRRNSENSVRVTNLAEEVTEDDLRDLFSPFGQISRVFLALDRESQRSRGFAFINYVRREDGARAIKALDGHGYANLILHCEWAAPRAPKPT